MSPNVRGNKPFLHNPFTITILVIVALFIFFFISSKLISITQKWQEGYSEIVINKYYAGKIINVQQDKGITFLTLTNSSKIWLPHSRNYDYRIKYLNDFIVVGDSILKHKDSDSLFIYRNNCTYYFVIGKFINE